MKITKTRLKEIIKEEVVKILNETQEKTEVSGVKVEEEEVDETMDSGYLPEPKNKKDEDK